MKIQLVTGAYYPSLRHGGPVVTNHSLAKALIELGHNVSILTTDIDGDGRLELESLDSVWDGVPVRYCHCDKFPLPYLSIDMHYVLQKQQRPDIVLMASAWAMYGLVVGRYCRKNKIPYIMYGHGSHDPYRMSKGYLKKKLFWYLGDRHLYRNADMLVALTENERCHYKALKANDNIEVIPNGVSFDEQEFSIPCSTDINFESIFDGKKYILFLGRIEPVKGIDILIEAFSVIKEQYPDHLLVLAGPDEEGYLAVVEKLIAKYKLNDYVIIPGSVCGDAKRKLFEDAELFVLTSYGEGLPMAVLEAMACGCPVLITHQCNIPEVEYCNAGIIVESNSCSIVKGLELVLNSNDKEQMGRNGRRLVADKFSWENVARQTESLCGQVLNKRKASGC